MVAQDDKGHDRDRGTNGPYDEVADPVVHSCHFSPGLRPLQYRLDFKLDHCPAWSRRMSPACPMTGDRDRIQPQITLAPTTNTRKPRGYSKQYARGETLLPLHFP